MLVRKQRYHARDEVRQRLYRSRNATRDVSSRCRDGDPIQYAKGQLGVRLAVFQVPDFRLGNSVGVTRDPHKRDGSRLLAVPHPLLFSIPSYGLSLLLRKVITQELGKAQLNVCQNNSRQSLPLP